MVHAVEAFPVNKDSGAESRTSILVIFKIPQLNASVKAREGTYNKRSPYEVPMSKNTLLAKTNVAIKNNTVNDRKCFLVKFANAQTVVPANTRSPSMACQ